MKNKLEDLNNHLFAQLERLGDEDSNEKQLHIEIERSKAIASIAKSVIDNASLVLQAEKLKRGVHDNADPNYALPALLQAKGTSA